MVRKGASPREMFSPRIEKSNDGQEYNERERTLIPYLYELIRIQRAIDINRKMFEERLNLFKVSVYLSTAVLIVDVLYYSISHY